MVDFREYNGRIMHMNNIVKLLNKEVEEGRGEYQYFDPTIDYLHMEEGHKLIYDEGIVFVKELSTNSDMIIFEVK